MSVPKMDATEKAYVMVNVMGRRRRMAMSVEDARQYRKDCREWSRIKDQHRKAARTAVARAVLGGGAAIIDAIAKVRRCSTDSSSEARLPTILNLLSDATAKVFWPVFGTEWTGCDATWSEQLRLLPLLKRHAEQRYKGCNKFWRALPESIQVYRGCSQARVQGLSWTTDRETAEKFAQGHRGIRVPDPVVVSATLAKRDVLWATDSRDESEILLDPATLANLSIIGGIGS